MEPATIIFVKSLLFVFILPISLGIGSLLIGKRLISSQHHTCLRGLLFDLCVGLPSGCLWAPSMSVIYAEDLLFWGPLFAGLFGSVQSVSRLHAGVSGIHCSSEQLYSLYFLIWQLLKDSFRMANRHTFPTALSGLGTRVPLGNVVALVWAWSMRTASQLTIYSWGSCCAGSHCVDTWWCSDLYCDVWKPQDRLSRWWSGCWHWPPLFD